MRLFWPVTRSESRSWVRLMWVAAAIFEARGAFSKRSDTAASASLLAEGCWSSGNRALVSSALTAGTAGGIISDSALGPPPGRAGIDDPAPFAVVVFAAFFCKIIVGDLFRRLAGLTRLTGRSRSAGDDGGDGGDSFDKGRPEVGGLPGSIDGPCFVVLALDINCRARGRIIPAALVCTRKADGAPAVFRVTDGICRAETMGGSCVSPVNDKGADLGCTHDGRTDPCPVMVVCQRRLTSVSSGRRSAVNSAARASTPEEVDHRITPGALI